MKRFLWLAGVLAISAGAAELPVRQVVLYKHGVGYFERAGDLAAGDSARLDFKASEMDDVLKSLTISEKGGGKIAGLRYDSSQPLAVKLADFPFQLGPGQPLTAVLDQLKGASIEMKFATEAVTGKIVAARLIAGDDKRPEREQITLLMDSGDLRNFDLGAASSVRFVDPRIQAQFGEYLAALTAARSKEKRSVYIDSTASQARQIVASYMTPTPIWKSSYRLILADAASTLEGWAIVDNTTGEDWNQVDLSLVSGRPISFVTRLYEPRYVTRPSAELPEDAAAQPQIHEGAIVEALSAEMAAPAMPPPPPAAAEPAPKSLPSNGRSYAQLSRLRRGVSTITAAAATAELGELFEYHIAAPVTVRRDESAMLPFLQQKLDARKLLIYTEADSVHPTNAIEIHNATGKTLDGGPVTVYDSGAYAGEALMETLKSNDKRLISYAVDLGTRVTTAFDSRSDTIRELHARHGILTSRSALVELKTYTLHNVDSKAKTLLIEHAARAGYDLVEPQPQEKTTGAYRFEVKLAPGVTRKFPVTEERVYEQTLTVTDLTPDVLLTYTRNKALTEAGRRQLEQIASRKQKILEASREMERLDRQMNDLVHDQERLRQNIASLNPVSGQQQQVQAYAQQLASQESQLASMRDRRAELDRQRAASQSELSTAIEDLSF